MRSMKNRKLHGSVLLTVVAVMSLLIIFLFGTLALATATNNRAHVNYSQAQTGITARTIVDTAFKTLGESKDFASAFNKLDESSGVMDIPVSLSGDASTGFGHINSLTAEYDGTKLYYNDSEKVWKEYPVVKLTANVTMAGVTSQATAYVVKDPPNPGGGSGNGAGFVTTGGANLACQSRLYGGSYLGLPDPDIAKDYDYSYTGTQKYLSHDTFSFANTNSLLEADAVINGNLGSTTQKSQLTEISIPGEGTGVTVWGDVYFHKETGTRFTSLYNSTSDVDFNKIPYLYIDGEVSGDEIVLGPNSNTESLPNIEGKNLSNEQFPFNVFVGSVNANEIEHTFEIGGDLYIMNPNKISYLNPKDAGNLYKWTADVVNKTQDSRSIDKTGNIYSKASVVINSKNGFTVDGDLRVEGDLTVPTFDGGNLGGMLTVNGDIVVKGTLKVDGNLKCNGTIYADSITGKNAVGEDEITINVESIPGKKYMRFKNAFIDHGSYQQKNAYVLITEDDFNTLPAKYKVPTMQNVNGTDYECYDFGGDPDYTSMYAKAFPYDAYAWSQEPIQEIKYYADANGNKIYDEGEMVVSSPDPVKVYGKPTKVCDQDVKKLSDWTTDIEGNVRPIYPAYAEREVILGITPLKDKEGNDIPFEKTQIVKRMNQLLKDVVNPYDNTTLPESLTKLKNKIINNEADDYFVIDKATITTNDLEAYGKLDGDTIKINKSCKIRLTSTGTETITQGSHNNIMFCPGDKDMLVLIDGNVQIQMGINVKVDDSGKGKVYFFINQNSKLGMQSSLSTTSAEKFIANLANEPAQIYTDKVYAKSGIKTAAELGLKSPGVYILGTDSSTFRIDNFDYVAANIVSSKLHVDILSTANNPFKGTKPLYYNGKELDMSTFYSILGCCNSESVFFQNLVNMIYVPGGDTSNNVVNDDLNNWYKLLYYDEY